MRPLFSPFYQGMLKIVYLLHRVAFEKEPMMSTNSNENFQMNQSQKPIDIFQMLTCPKEMTNSKSQYPEMISNKSENTSTKSVQDERVCIIDSKYISYEILD